MNKLKMQTPNKADGNVEVIAALFPNCVTETIGADGKRIAELMGEIDLLNN